MNFWKGFMCSCAYKVFDGFLAGIGIVIVFKLAGV